MPLDRDGDGWITANENPLVGMQDPELSKLITENAESKLPGSLSGNDAVDFNYNDINAWKEVLYNRFKNGDDAAGERLFNYLVQEEANKNSLDYSKNAYSYMMDDLLKAGISPYIISGASPTSMSFGSSSGSQMTSKYTNDQNLEKASRENASDRLNVLLRMIGLVVAALIYAA